MVLVLPVTARAQTPTGPPAPYAIDVRGVLGGVPRDPSFYPLFAIGTALPTRSFGVAAGGQVYPFSLGPARLGFGVDVFWTRATASPSSITTSTTTTTTTTTGTPASTIPSVVTRFTAVAPQVSFNFGNRAGWSYLSAGVGTARVGTTT